MKKLVLRIVSIAAAFLLGVLGMGYYLMAGNTDSTAHMASATLPLIYLEQGGRSFNLMHGYTKSMDASSIRDAVLPLPEDREISLRIESPDTAVQDIHYEVRSLDMDRLIEDGELEFTREGDTIRADFQLMDLLEDGGEYLLALRLSLEQGREAYYYTHIANVGGTHLMECLELVDTIHGALFDKDNTVSIAQYMETDSSADNDTLDYVSIHSRYNQMIWANMEVEPPEGEDHLTVSGDLNDILRDLIGDRFDGLFFVPEVKTGVTVTGWQVDRYVTLSDAITKLLDSKGYRIQIGYVEPEGLEYGYVSIQAVPVVDYSEDLEYSREGKVNFGIRDYRGGVNHLICAGKGQNEERVILHLYVQEDGSIGETQHYTGLAEHAATYEFSSADPDKLKEDGMKRLKDLQNYKSIDVTVDDVDLEIGDIVGGYEEITGTRLQKPVTRKIINMKQGKITINYEVKGDD